MAARKAEAVGLQGRAGQGRAEAVGLHVLLKITVFWADEPIYIYTSTQSWFQPVSSSTDAQHTS